ncbi:MAG: ABC transporter permease subunit [Nitrospirae bacterium]|nr:ABC transporter permease subunit [Nitrospirota bacterium]
MKIFYIMKKELRGYLLSPVAYVLITVFLVVMGFLFYNIVSFYSLQSTFIFSQQGVAPEFDLTEVIFRPTFINMSVVFLLVMPILTMRFFAEEKRSRTIELLMTSPISITEIILGKYLASVLILCLMLLLTIYMPVIISLYGTVNWGQIASGYIGLFLVGMIFLSIGILASSMTENQIIAAILSFGMLLILWIIRMASQIAGSTTTGDILSFLSITEHMDNLIKGLIDTRDVIYYLTVSIFGLFLTHRVIESQRWR